MERTRRIVIMICVLLGLSGLTTLDAIYGGLRFVSSRANEITNFAALCLPLVCIILLTCLPRSKARLLGLVVLIPLAALCVLGGIGDLIGEAAFPATVKRESSIRLGYSHIVTYFEDDGVMGDGDFFVQQEIKMLPGLLWVWPVLNEDGADNISIKVLNHHHVQCRYVAYNEDSLDPSSKAKQRTAWVF